MSVASMSSQRELFWDFKYIEEIRVGWEVGSTEGVAVGEAVGDEDGRKVGDDEGWDVGRNVGEDEGENVGETEGDLDGLKVGFAVGRDGTKVGVEDGAEVGVTDGDLVGKQAGDNVGVKDGDDEGLKVGEHEGGNVGAWEGEVEGTLVGFLEGVKVGLREGAKVGLCVAGGDEVTEGRRKSQNNEQTIAAETEMFDMVGSAVCWVVLWRIKKQVKEIFWKHLKLRCPSSPLRGESPGEQQITPLETWRKECPPTTRDSCLVVKQPTQQFPYLVRSGSVDGWMSDCFDDVCVSGILDNKLMLIPAWAGWSVVNLRRWR
jgi:hypothetical protein